MSGRAVVVCDASPLIFLAKLGRLDLITTILDGNPFVLRCVVDKVLPEELPPAERTRLEGFFQSCQVVDFIAKDSPSTVLSLSDRSTLAWCAEHRPRWLVADECLLRRCVQDMGVRVIGFLGILVGAHRCRVLTAGEARALVESAVREHGCRISTALYAHVVSELGA